MDSYKLEQLKIMLEWEKNAQPNEQYGAHLTHWSGQAKPINIDAGALEALIAYYERKKEA